MTSRKLNICLLASMIMRSPLSIKASFKNSEGIAC